MLFVALVGWYSSAILKSAGVGANLPRVSIPRIIPEELSMANPHYEGFGKDGSSYVLDSKTAQQDLGKPNSVKLNGITGTLLQADKSKTLLTATRGEYNSKSSVLELYENIDVNSESGLKAQLTRATLTAKDNVLVSKEPVSVEFTGGSVRANSMTLRHKVREVTFVDNVAARMIPQSPDASKAPETVAAAASATSMFATSSAPLDITSSRLDIKDAIKTAVFTGSVKAIQNDQSLLTPELTVTYDGDALATTKPAEQQAGGSDLATGKIRRIVAKGPVVMERAGLDRVTADAMDFDAQAQTGSLVGNVIMESGEDRRATAEQADLDQKASTILLSGNVIVVQGKNELKGGRFFVDRGNGRALLTSPAGAGPSRITARLVQGDGKDKKGTAKAKPAAAEPAEAVTAAGSFKTDPNAPVDIEADQLDINDSQKTAVFRGDVKAVQGEFVIKTPELVATYSGNASLADLTQTATGAADAKKQSAELTRIEAKTKVNVTSKDGQSVDGDWAIYDAKANTVVVGGEVVLSKGGSMVRGTRLLIDTVSGESTIETAPGKAVAVPGGGGWSTEAPPEGEAANRGRPSAVFFPGELRQSTDGKSGSKKDKPAKADTAAPTGAGAWKAETSPPQALQPDN